MAKLYFYYSAMNAGKSAVLLQSDHNYRERGMNTLLFTPKLDDRYGEGKISSRIGIQRPAEIFEADFDFFSTVRQTVEQGPVHCILVDEAQFLSKIQVLQLSLIVDYLGIPVLCYGLRSDFRGEPFEGAKYLLTWGDELCEIKTICRTGSKATMNARLDAHGNRVWDGGQVEIGHNYMSMSRKEFKLHDVVKDEYSIEEDKLSRP